MFPQTTERDVGSVAHPNVVSMHDGNSIAWFEAQPFERSERGALPCCEAR
jgi:hypothetical protein